MTFIRFQVDAVSIFTHRPKLPLHKSSIQSFDRSLGLYEARYTIFLFCVSVTFVDFILRTSLLKAMINCREFC
jgi:hypothetical protein